MAARLFDFFSRLRNICSMSKWCTSLLSLIIFTQHNVKANIDLWMLPCILCFLRLKIHINLITANRKHKKTSQDNRRLDGFALTASIYWRPLCGRFSWGSLSRLAVDGMCHSVFDFMCICVRWLWKYRFATQNDVYLHQVRRCEAKVLVWELSKSFQWVFMCACALVWFIQWSPPS